MSKERILDELQNLQGIVEKRNTMPILANVLLNVTDNEVEITGTDLEVGMRTHFAAAIEETGTVTVSGKKLFEIVKSLPDGQDVHFKQNEDMMMEVTAGESEFKVLCLPKDDYPAVPLAKFERNIQIPVEEIRMMIDRVLFAIAQEQRYYLNGALMVIKSKSLEMVSTDGHRLSYVSRKTDLPDVGETMKVIVAKKTLNEIKKFEDGHVEFDMDENNLFFRCGHRTLISRIIESKFPNYEAVIPKDNPHVATLNKDIFAGAIRRVSLLSAERSKGVKFTVEKNRLRLFSSNPEMGEARDKIDVEYKGPSIEIGFNAQYFLDFLGVVTTEKIRFELKDENSAALLRPEGEEELKSQYVLMPMKI
ncbi:MAG: DNA polymerase III subunit beta [Candidatus Aminicenantes bacterium]|nr:DNA polymerase III subunit beta [Candidatus Aminicenantes bacterium]